MPAVLPPARTWLLLVALAAAGVAVALGVTAGVERARPGWIGPNPPPFYPVEIPRFDVHQHWTPRTVEEAVRLARAHGIGAIVNHSGGHAGGPLERSLEAARPLGDRVVVLQNLDFAGCCTPGWAQREAKRLATGEALGARGLAVPTALEADRVVPLDAGELDSVFAAAAELGLPVFVHAPRSRVALHRRLLRSPATTFVASAFAGAPDDPAAVAALLATLPNLHVDTAGVTFLGRDAAAAREAILAHPDRVLFGTDVELVELGDVKAAVFGGGGPGGRAEMLRFFDGTWRFFETRDPEIPAPVPAHGDAPVRGIGLPRHVLERVYRRNAERLFGVAIPDAQRERARAEP
jgi:hypothetical protein